MNLLRLVMAKILAVSLGLQRNLLTLVSNEHRCEPIDGFVHNSGQRKPSNDGDKLPTI